MSTSNTKYVLKIPGAEPVEIEGWEAMDAAQRKLAMCFALASRMGVTAGLNALTLMHMDLCQNAPNLAPLAEAVWPRARRDFVMKCAKLGFVFDDDDRITVAQESR